MEKEEKQLFSYKRGFDQPIFVKELSDNFSLPFAVEMSTLLYFIFFTPIFFFLLMSVGFLEWGWCLVVGSALGWKLGKILTNNKIDGKTIVIYLRDYIFYFWNYGRYGKKYYINKGKRYVKIERIYRGNYE